MNYHVSLGFDNINAEEGSAEDHPKGYGVDHLRVAEGLGCKGIRVSDPDDIADALRRAEVLAKEHKVPVVVEIILERITNIAMGTELDNVNEFEPLSENEEFLLAAGLND